MIIVWDNGAPGYDGHDIDFYELGTFTLEEAGALLKLAENDGRVIATVPSIDWTNGSKGGADLIGAVARRVWLPYLDEDSSEEEQEHATERTDELVANVPARHLALVAAAMRKEKRCGEDVLHLEQVRDRKRNAERRAAARRP